MGQDQENTIQHRIHSLLWNTGKISNSSFGLKTQKLSKDVTPGPGTYQSPQNLFNSWFGVIDKDKRGELSKSTT